MIKDQPDACGAFSLGRKGKLKRFAFNLRHQLKAKRVQRRSVACVSRKAVIQVFREKL
jgi:ribosomal protein L3